MRKFCPRCGKETDKLYDGLCLDCYIETHNLVPKIIRIKRCSSCGRYFVRGKYFQRIEDAVEFFLRKTYEKTLIENVSFRIRDEENVFITLDKKEFPSKIKIESFVCNSCRKKRYTQAVVQVRGRKEFVNNFLKDLINKIENSKDRTLQIKKIETNKNGVNVEVSSKKGIKRIIKSLEKKYNLSVKISRKIVGLKDGKTQYKDYLSVKEWQKRK